MESFLIQFLNSMMSETGVLSVVLLAATVYQTNQLGKCRVRNEELHEQILKLSLSQVSAMKEIARYLKLKGVN